MFKAQCSLPRVNMHKPREPQPTILHCLFLCTHSLWLYQILLTDLTQLLLGLLHLYLEEGPSVLLCVGSHRARQRVVGHNKPSCKVRWRSDGQTDLQGRVRGYRWMVFIATMSCMVTKQRKVVGELTVVEGRQCVLSTQKN